MVRMLVLLVLLVRLVVRRRRRRRSRRRLRGRAVAIVGRVQNRAEIHGCWDLVTRACGLLRETMDRAASLELSSMRRGAVVRLGQRRLRLADAVGPCFGL